MACCASISTAQGGSGGDFANMHFSSHVDDLVAAADWLRTERGAPALLVGYSLGGAAVLGAAHRVPDAVAAAKLGAPFDPAHVTRQFAGRVAPIEADGEANVQLAGRPFRVKRALLHDLHSQHQAARIRNLRRALLVLHAPLDEIGPVDDARQIFEAALHPKSFPSLVGADHLLTRAADARFAAGLIAAWAGRCVDAGDGASTTAANATVTAPDGKVRIVERGTNRFTVAISAGRHSWLGDEPASVGGGGDLGPSPYEMLSTVLGACSAMTLCLYARQKCWPLDAVQVVLDHAKIHAGECAERETRDGRTDRIEREIRIEGKLSNEQNEHLLENRRPMPGASHVERAGTDRDARSRYRGMTCRGGCCYLFESYQRLINKRLSHFSLTTQPFSTYPNAVARLGPSKPAARSCPAVRQ